MENKTIKTKERITALLILMLILGFAWYSHTNLVKIKTGVIEGSLSYPSDVIPENMVVCAEDIFTKKQLCTNYHIKSSKYKYNIGYKIDAPVGDYYVFAKDISSTHDLKDHVAYYSDFVTCGMNINNCHSHNPIRVAVIYGETTKNINPWDWYNY